MVIGVVGSGAVGGFVGAVLKKAGFDVIFLARGQHLQSMNEKGLHIHSGSSSFHVNGEFTSEMKDMEKADYILFTVKSSETRDIARKLQPFLKAGTFVLTLQNGVDNEEILSEILGEEKILSGAAYITSTVKEPGVIRQEGTYSFVIGSFHESGKQAAIRMEEVFQIVGIPCRVSKDVLTRKWDKLLWNVTFNPLSASTMATVGEILDDKHLRKTAEQALGEAIAVGKACGIEVRDKVIDRIFPSAETVRHHKTSMLQDRERGKKMEIESLCGFFVSKAERLGLDTPVLRTLYAVLSSMEQKGE